MDLSKLLRSDYARVTAPLRLAGTRRLVSAIIPKVCTRQKARKIAPRTKKQGRKKLPCSNPAGEKYLRLHEYQIRISRGLCESSDKKVGFLWIEMNIVFRVYYFEYQVMLSSRVSENSACLAGNGVSRWTLSREMKILERLFFRTFLLITQPNGSAPFSLFITFHYFSAILWFFLNARESFFWKIKSLMRRVCKKQWQCPLFPTLFNNFSLFAGLFFHTGQWEFNEDRKQWNHRDLVTRILYFFIFYWSCVLAWILSIYFAQRWKNRTVE